MKNYRVGIVGCGKIARLHARAYISIPGVKIVAGAEINPENAKMFSEEFGVRRMYTDYVEMLQKEKLDLVSICTWPRTHCEITVTAAESGVKGIMCEKPIAVTLEEADKMINTCNKENVKLAVGHQHRFDPQSAKAKELLEQGVIGEPVVFWGHSNLDLMNNGTHVIDLINFFNNDEPVDWVIGQIDRRNKRLGFRNHPDMPVEDMAIGRVKYRNGLRATVEVGEFAPLAFQFHLFGTEGIIDVYAHSGTAVRVLSRKGVISEFNWEGTGETSRRSELTELIASVEENREHLSSGRKGRAALEIIIAIFESSRRRGLIDFPTNLTDFPLESMIREGII